MAKGSAVWLPSPDPPPRKLGNTSRVPWRKLAKYQKPRRGCRRGLAWQYRGDRCQTSRMGQWGSGGCCPPRELFSRASLARGSGPGEPGTYRLTIEYTNGGYEIE